MAKGKLPATGGPASDATLAADAEADRTNAVRQSEGERMLASIRDRKSEYGASVSPSTALTSEKVESLGRHPRAATNG